jgi:hypothetical protein
VSKPLSIADMTTRLESTLESFKHDCQGKRNCPLNSQLAKTVFALRNLTLHPEGCFDCDKKRRRTTCRWLL